MEQISDKGDLSYMYKNKFIQGKILPLEYDYYNDLASKNHFLPTEYLKGFKLLRAKLINRARKNREKAYLKIKDAYLNLEQEDLDTFGIPDSMKIRNGKLKRLGKLYFKYCANPKKNAHLITKMEILEKEIEQDEKDSESKKNGRISYGDLIADAEKNYGFDFDRKKTTVKVFRQRIERVIKTQAA